MAAFSLSPTRVTAAPVPDSFRLDCRGRIIDCRPTAPPIVMGILNVTPDSFSDGGCFTTEAAAVDRAARMLEEGAGIIDIGGESTRPRGKAYGRGAASISAQEEIDRTAPVVEAITKRFPHALLSIDTYKGEVARAGLRAGAHMVNDVSGLRQGVGTASAAAEFGAALIVMHSVGKPGSFEHIGTYGDVVDDVRSSLVTSVKTARSAGVRHVVVDPGFGFGKSVTDNLRLIAKLDALEDVGCPILVGLSRKSSIGIVLGSEARPFPIENRLFGTLGLTALAVIRGAKIVRTHDVEPTAQLLQALYAAQALSTGEAVA